MAPSGVPQAECYSAQQRPSPQAISTSLGNPGETLQRYPQAGAQLISTIRDLAASDPAALPVILGLLGSATKDQTVAIASALAQAAKICVRTDQPYALQIQQAVALTKDEEVVLAFASVAGDVPTGGIGAGGGAVGGQTNPLPGNTTSSGGAEAIPGSSVKTPEFSFSSSAGGTGGLTGSVSSK